MPCNGPTEESWAKYQRSRGIQNLHNKGEVEATLCGILTVLEKRGALELAMNEVDWLEAGVSRRDALNWWADHKKKDEERKALG